MGRVGRGLPGGTARNVRIGAFGFAEALCHGAFAFSSARSAGHQAFVLHADCGWICVRLRNPRANSRRSGAENTFAGRTDVVLPFWQCFGAGHTSGWSIFASTRASHAALRARTAPYTARASVVGRHAERRRKKHEQREIFLPRQRAYDRSWKTR